jgi:hypothetical protein
MMKRQSYWTLLTFIPSIIYWYFLCDENTTLTGVVALIMVLLATSLYTLIENDWTRTVYFLVFSFLLYYMVGGAYVLFIFFSILIEYVYFENMKSVSAVIGTIGGIAIAVGLPLVISHFSKTPLYQLYWGINYNHSILFKYTTFLYIWIPTVLVPFMFVIIPELKKHIVRYTTAEFVGIVLFIIICLWQGYNGKKETTMCYDYMLHNKQWNNIIDKADQKSPRSIPSLSILNLALCQEAKMGDNIFDYVQKGKRGLFPPYQKDFNLPLVTSEIYYYLGLTEKAQALASKEMDSLTYHHYSGRTLCRLAEINLINGNYKVANQYLIILQHSLLYRNFANRIIPLLWNEKAINEHSEYSWLRKCRLPNEASYDDKDKDVMLKALFMHNRKNRMAFEYLMSYYLLTKSLAKFARNVPLGTSIDYDHMPSLYQKALEYIQARGK